MAGAAMALVAAGLRMQWPGTNSVEKRGTNMKFNACMDRRPLCVAIGVSLLLATGAASAEVVCDTTPPAALPSTATGIGAMACGRMNDASGVGSGAFGTGNTTSGEGSNAFGVFNLASGSRAIAVGRQNEASGERSATLGSDNLASGEQSSAFGVNNSATAIASTAVGYRNIANP